MISVWDLLPALWPLLILVLTSGIIRLIVWIARSHRLWRAGIPEIDEMDGEQFERKLAILFRQKGYQVARTPYQGDWGADLILSKAGRRIAVQAKRWNKRVDPRAVQEIVAAKAKYGCSDAMVVTNSYFTRAARELARANGVELWDRARLAKERWAVQEGRQASAGTSEPVSAATDGEAASADAEVGTRPNPRCFQCGREMVLKHGRYGPFWACSSFPECRNTFPAPAVDRARR